ncbi:MAG: sigma-70 family RNA polymerase sigma factor [Pyrinomonadaceae bacterium]|nr:sigma-70 family RNA polymerase sigma factor [Pyrinomonadaceae bacterium]
MIVPPEKEVTRLLEAWSHGNQEALDQLMPLVYEELRQMAKNYMNSQSSGHTLQTTALIHEAYLKLADQREKRWQNRAHFFAVAAQAMRHILVDHARSHQTQKRGGETQIISLEEAAIISKERANELVALDEALKNLSALDERKGQVVELRYFGGLSVEETAEVLKISEGTVLRDWRFAKTWLLRELSGQ